MQWTSLLKLVTIEGNRALLYNMVGPREDFNKREELSGFVRKGNELVKIKN